MLVSDVFKQIQADRPRLIYVSGKTCVGKSTFAKRLHDNLGYEILELDQIVQEAVIRALRLPDEGEAFIEVYHGGRDRRLLDPFIIAVKSRIAAHLAAGDSLVIDGAIANPAIVTELFADFPTSLFIYFHPADLERYQRNIASRFLLATAENRAGLPMAFWQLIGEDAFAAFCRNRQLTAHVKEAIRIYVRSSSKASTERLARFRVFFPELLLIEIYK